MANMHIICTTNKLSKGRKREFTGLEASQLVRHFCEQQVHCKNRLVRQRAP